MGTLTDAAKAHIRSFALKQVTHTRQKEVLDQVWESLDADDHNITIVVGPSGVGKTNLLELVELEAMRRLRAEPDRDGRLPYVYVAASPPERDTFRFISLYRSILSNTAEIEHPKKTIIGAPSERHSSSDVVHRAAINVLKYRLPVVFCIDEAQHIAYGSAERLQSHFDHVKALADAINSPILMAGTHKVLDMALASGQLARRVRHVGFLPYRANKPEMGSHYAAVRYFVSVLPIKLSFEPERHVEFFFERSVGSVGVLKPWFDRVLRRVLTDGRHLATLDDFEHTAMPMGKLTKLASEYSDALMRLNQVDGNRLELRQQLGFAAPVAHVVSPSVPKRGVGQRTLKRDPVGTAA